MLIYERKKLKHWPSVGPKGLRNIMALRLMEIRSLKIISYTALSVSHYTCILKCVSYEEMLRVKIVNEF